MSCVHHDDGTKNVQIPLFLFPCAMVQGMISISLWCALHKPMYTYIYIQFSGVTAYMIFVRSFVPEVVAPSDSLNIDAGKTRVLFPLLLCSLWCVQIERIVYLLEWRTVSAHTRGLFWCLFPSLLRNSGSKHQNNPLVSAEIVCNSSTYTILFFTRHNDSKNDDKNDDLYTSLPCLTGSVFVLLVTSQWIADDVTKTR